MKKHEKAWTRLQNWIKNGNAEDLAYDDEAMERLANDAEKDASSYINDTQQQRESVLDALGMPELVYCTADEVKARYERLVNDDDSSTENDEDRQMKQTTLAYYLSFRDKRAFHSFFGRWMNGYERVAGGTGTLAKVLDFIQMHDPDLYADLWDTIVAAMESATAPAERPKQVDIRYQEYSEIIHDFSQDTEHMFNPAKNRPAYEDSVKYPVTPYQGGVPTFHTLKIEYRYMVASGMVVDGAFTDKFYEELGLNRFDQKVMHAISTCYETRWSTEKDGYVIIPLVEVARLVFPYRKIGAEHVELVNASCEKMRHTFIRIDFPEEAKRRNRRSKGNKVKPYLDGYLLSYYGTAIEVKNQGELVPCIILSAKPTLKQWGNFHRQIQRIDIPAGETAKKIEAKTPEKYKMEYMKLQQAVRQKVLLMKRCAVSKRDKLVKKEKRKGYTDAPSAALNLNDVYSEKQRTLSLDELYAESGATTEQRIRTVRGNTKKVLEELKIEGQITKWEEHSIGMKIVGYVITLSEKV